MNVTASSEMTRLHELSAQQGRQITELQAEKKRLSMRCKQQEENYNTLMAQNRRLLSEYIKTWEVLRTYNPKDIELEYIGFEAVEGGDG